MTIEGFWLAVHKKGGQVCPVGKDGDKEISWPPQEMPKGAKVFSTFEGARSHATKQWRECKNNHVCIIRTGKKVCAEWGPMRVVWSNDPKHPATKGYGMP